MSKGVRQLGLSLFDEPEVPPSEPAASVDPIETETTLEVRYRPGGAEPRLRAHSVDDPAPTVSASGIGTAFASQAEFVTRPAALKSDAPVPEIPDELSENTRVSVIDVDDVAPTVQAGNASIGDARQNAFISSGLVVGGDKPPYRIPLMPEIRALPWNGLNVISTFSGCGGSSLGYKMAGYRVLWANEFVPAAQDTYRANHEGTHVDTSDIRLVTAQSIRAVIGDAEIDIFDGSPPCFGKGTPVVTRRGVIPIESVVAGDEVLTHTRSWQRVVRTMSREARTVLVDGRIVVTPDHLFLTRLKTRPRGAIRLDSQAWRPASEIDTAFVGTPVIFPSDEAYPDAPCGFEYCYDFWYVVGRWLGDGWVRLSQGDSETISASERRPLNATSVACLMCGEPSARYARASHASLFTSYCSAKCRKRFERRRHKRPRAAVLICAAHKEADELLARLLRLGIAVGISKQRSTTRFTLSRRSLTEWLIRLFGRGARYKTMPGWVFGIEAEWRRAIFDGYVDADGHRTVSGTVRAASVSRCLATSFALLAGTLGMTTSIVVRRRRGEGMICGRKVNVADSYSVQAVRDDGRYTRVDDGIRWRRLRRQTIPHKLVTVYDLEVEIDHSFVADGVVVHNCASFSTAGKTSKGWGQVRNYSDVKQRTDDLFEQYIRLVGELQPRAFVAENVSGMTKGVAIGFFNEYLAKMKALPYNVEARLLDAQWLGVPQRRVRVIFIGVRKDVGKPAWPTKLMYRYSIRDAIPWISVASASAHSATDWQKPEDRMSADEPAPTLPSRPEKGSYSGVTIERDTALMIQDGARPAEYSSVDAPSPAIMASRSVDLLRVVEDKSALANAVGGEWDKLKVGEQSDKYLSLIRPDPDDVCPTVTQLGGTTAASVTHPYERRKFSIAELRRVCGFPDDFVLTGSFAQQWERMGRAVPPPMMRAVAEALAPVLRAGARRE